MRKTASRRGLMMAVGMLTILNSSCMGLHYVPDYRPDSADAPIFAQAQAVDSLESRIEQYGSIVAKPADVWGQARLMLHRNEFEEAMRKEAGNFKVAFEQEVVGHDSTSIAGQLNLAGVLAPTGKSASKTPAAPAKPAETDAKKSTAAAKESQPTALSLSSIAALDQKSEYLNHLNELRRINEGDDTADFPGYSLNLIRIPVSILPGTQTRLGYGAEITFTARPSLEGSLLPRTIRCLVVNDLVDQLAVPLKTLFQTVEVEYELRSALADDEELRGQREIGAESANARKAATLETVACHLRKLVRQGASAGSRRRSGRLPLSTSQIMDCFGSEILAMLTVEVHHSLGERCRNSKSCCQLDVQRSLEAEIESAYDLLTCPDNLSLWSHCDRTLAVAIRSRQDAVIADKRQRFVESMRKVTTAKISTVALAWAIMVESALLNEHLVADMNEIAEARGCACRVGEGATLIGLHPSAEARQAFNAYVACRWPIRIFALEPDAQVRNVRSVAGADRDANFALAAALAAGHLQGSSLAQYAHGIQESATTTGTQASIVGFCHAGQTFGWRFLPRPASRPVAGKQPSDSLAEMEPGIRECVALVLMPSLVPGLCLDAQSRWFSLANPQQSVPRLEETVNLKKSLQALQVACEQTVANKTGGVQADPDTVLLLRRLEQLAARLPVQTQRVQVPFENALGGFEMFSTGSTMLTPQLIGWSGSFGIDPAKDSSIFLVGNNFSIDQTRIIAGGKALDASRVELLSRQVMRVTIPPGVISEHDKVPVYIATPNGVTQPLYVPIVVQETLAAQPAAPKQALKETPGQPAATKQALKETPGQSAGPKQAIKETPAAQPAATKQAHHETPPGHPAATKQAHHETPPGQPPVPKQAHFLSPQ